MNSPESNAPQTPPSPPPVAPPAAAGPADALTPEEQMAKFEEELKFDDWGHQPC